MVLDLRVAFILGIFTVVCISLIIFNLMVTHTNIGRRRASISARMTKRWREILYKQTDRFKGKKDSETQHNKVLLRKLANAEELVAYSDALNYIKSEFPEEYSEYINTRHEIFQQLANKYSKRTAVERACYAEFVYEFPQVMGESYEQLSDTLISYINNSANNTYCRTNVMRALCSMGNARGIGNALQVVNDKQLFIHNHVLTDELAKFVGDKETLAKHLWSEALQWSDNLKISVIQFITRVSSEYGEAFLPVLQGYSADSEVRIAVIRYYGEYAYEAAVDTLTELTLVSANINLAAEAALALSSYPAPKTYDTLKKALYSPEWNVRYNASAALLKLGDVFDLPEFIKDESDHAKEIILHMIEQGSAVPQQELDGEIVSV